MTSAAANYQESTSFIHHRYEDTAQTIFHQQQKVRQDEKKRKKQQERNPQNQLAVTFPYDDTVNRYGNRAIVATETDIKQNAHKDKSLTPHKKDPQFKPQPTPRSKDQNHAKESRKENIEREQLKPKESKQKDSFSSVEIVKNPIQPTIKSSVCILS